MAAVVVLSLLTVGAAGFAATSAPSAAAASTASSGSCNQTVVHDAYRSQAAIDTVNDTDEATSTVDNTQTRLEDVTGFVRLHAKNPNGYCVQYTVEISPEIVSAADLGEIESQDGNATASWRAANNLSSGDVYTTVSFTLGPGEEALFAPSEVRVKSLSWTGEAKRESQGILDSVRSLFADDELEHSTYQISPSSNSSRQTVLLENEDGRSIEDWQATYTVNGNTRPVTQDASEPVYYSESGSSVTFHFSSGAVQDNASVEFVADPGFVESAQHGWTSYASGWDSITDLSPFAISPAAEVLGT